jgi:hypothetical protein
VTAPNRSASLSRSTIAINHRAHTLMSFARRLKLVLVICALSALAFVASSMVAMAIERHRLTSDPLALERIEDVRAACVVLIERSLSRGGSYAEARVMLAATMLKLRDGWSGLDRAACDTLLADIYDRLAARIAAPDAANQDELLAVLSQTRPTADNSALWERYTQALERHGIAAIAP